MFFKFKIVIVLLIGIPIVAVEASPPERILRYDSPAREWQGEALPLGNGRLGCMVFGGVVRERLQFNEDSLWIGDEVDTGAYQAFGDLFVEFDHKDVKDYSRQLNLRDAVYTQEYKIADTQFRRQYFASHPAQILVYRFTADQPGAYSGRVVLEDSHGAEIRCEKNKFVAKGNLRGFVYGETKRRKPGDEKYHIALQYEAQVIVLNEGGTLSADKESGIKFDGCDSLTILLAAGTDYVADRSLACTGKHPHERIEQQLVAASTRPFSELLKEHRTDYQSLFNRVSIDFGGSTSSKPTNERVISYSGEQPDHDLEELLFQYARYLMISSSRPGARPANLQGLWNESNNPIWRCDYHSDVNTQMNYWFTDPANLTECFEPLAEWVYSIREPRRKATFAAFGKPGWALRAENGLFGGSTWMWSKGDASWLAQNLWDHYAFTLDKKYLRTRVYPIQRDLCAYWLADLKELPNGQLVSPEGYSPEHGPHQDGVSFDQQLIWDLFSNTIETTKALDVDPEFRTELIVKRDRLLGPQIGRWGQLQEWMIDRDDPNDKHRHLSHMIAIHPGRQIAPVETPNLAKAASISLTARGKGSTGWNKAWKTCIWARLHQGNKAYLQINQLLTDGVKRNASKKADGSLDSNSGGIMGNLLDTHPPFQIDGNFGYAAGVCEMLLQSHLGYIQLLPALPDKWCNGSVQGLCARGGFELDFQWQDGRLQGGKIHSRLGSECRLLSTKPIAILKEDIEIATLRNGHVISFSTEAGAEYTIKNRK